MKHLHGSDIKNKQVLISKLRLEKENLQLQQKELQRAVAIKENQLKKHEEELLKMQESSELIVSEHALLRYLERVYKLDLSKLQNEITPQELKAQIKEYGNGTYKHDNFSIKVVDNVIVTVLN